jgi:EAL domain-containing protein (putative c-di-GMP-specific phosphodiesterase class I)
LKIETVAEMIETDAQAKTLEKFGVDLGQGYLFGRPSVDETFGDTPAANVAPAARRGGARDSWG